MGMKMIALGATALGAMLAVSACGAYEEGEEGAEGAEGADEGVGVAADEIEREWGETLGRDGAESDRAAIEDRARRCVGSPWRSYISRDPAVCAATEWLCAPGSVQFFDECGCGCTRPPPPVGQACGSATCAPGLECCNASCGICVRPGNFCIQIACVDPVFVE